MRPISHQLLHLLPATLALVLVAAATVALDAPVLSFTPNIAWLMTLVLVMHHPPAWPLPFAFALGLLQDFLYHTPLGAQALLTLLLYALVRWRMQRGMPPQFRLRWLEAAGVLVIFHLLLWLIDRAAGDAQSLRAAIRLGLINGLWFAVFYACLTRAFAGLPDAK
jgi:rod shape-determining protein MreD